MKERWLYFARDGWGYSLFKGKAIFRKTNTGFVWTKVGVSLCNELFERATKRKLKVGEQIRIPEKEFAKLFEKAEVI